MKIIQFAVIVTGISLILVSIIFILRSLLKGAGYTLYTLYKGIIDMSKVSLLKTRLLVIA